MQQFRKVLVGVPAPSLDADGNVIPDPPTQAALEQAAELAADMGSELTLMSVVDPPSAGFLASDEENEKFAARFMKEAETTLQAIASQMTEANASAKVSTKVVAGQPWFEMCKAVLTDGYDLVVAGTRNAGRLSRFLFGGTGLRLLRNCPCPVWIVKPREEEQGERDVLVATQLDDVGELGLSLAVNAASMLDARIHALHVLDLPPMRQLGMNSDEMEAYRTKKRDEADEQLKNHISQTDHRTTPHGVEPHILSGRPYVCILESIAKHSVDLLIMGTAARGGLPGALVGNTAEHLLSEIPCSILALKPSDFECPVKLDD